MHDERSGSASEPPSTRREYVATAGAVLGGLLAGCADQGGDGEQTPTSAPGETTSGEPAGTTTPTDGYSVSMAPMGEVRFDAVPERVYTGLPNTADMAVAAGRADAVEAVYYPEYHGTLLNALYERLDGVTFEWEGLTDAWNLGPEGFYDLDCDVHLTDPAYASTLDSLDRESVVEIRDQVAPWFGNYYSDRHRDPPDAWAEDYQYYSLWEIFRRVATVFRAGDRAAALAAEHESLRSTIQAGLPPAGERPTVALAFPGEDDTLWVYRLGAEGFLAAHTRPLGAHDAFGDVAVEGVQRQVDYEALLDADPDVLLVLFSMTSRYDIAAVRERLADHAVASQVSAVRDGRVYAQGARYQGPIMNLFQLEMTAKQLYPEQFGEWPGYVDGDPYPEIPRDEWLFDRTAVSAAVRGEATD